MLAGLCIQACSPGKAISCRAHSGIDLAIVLDSVTLYHDVLAACPDQLPDSLRERYTTATFAFTPTRSLEWEDIRTPPGDTIEGNVWRAGADPGVVLIGIAFVNRNRVLLNTIHIAALDSSASFTLADGIRSATRPSVRLNLTAR